MKADPRQMFVNREPHAWTARVAPQRAAHRRDVLARIAAQRDVAGVLPLIRTDAIIAGVDAPPDTGCHLAPSCLACPLDDCRRDEDLARLKAIAERRRRRRRATNRAHARRQAAARKAARAPRVNATREARRLHSANIAAAYALGAEARDLAAVLHIAPQNVYKHLRHAGARAKRPRRPNRPIDAKDTAA